MANAGEAQQLRYQEEKKIKSRYDTTEWGKKNIVKLFMKNMNSFWGGESCQTLRLSMQ